MRRPSYVLVLAIAGIAVVTVVGSVPSAAHEHVMVGRYELVVGWAAEPAIVGSLNGLDLGIEHHLLNGSTEWVSGVAGNLTATLRTGSASLVKALAPRFGRPGWYTFDVIPTREGAYSVRLVGTLNTTAVDVTVNLDPVAPRSAIEFPVTDPTPAGLQDQIAALARENAVLRVQMIGSAVIAYAGIALAILLGRRKRTAP